MQGLELVVGLGGLSTLLKIVWLGPLHDFVAWDLGFRV